LGVLVNAGYEAYQTVNAKVRTRELFCPFEVRVRPKFDDLLLDYKLLKGIEEVADLHAFWEKKAQRNISFTVLQFQPTWLIYSDNDHCHLTDMYFEEAVKAIKFEGRSGDVYLCDPTMPTDPSRGWFSPIFYFRHVVGGYELGLKVSNEWWKKMCAAHPTDEFTKTQVNVCLPTDEAKMTLATIPHAAFRPFYAKPKNFDEAESIWKAAYSELQQRGWKTDVHPSSNWTWIEHKYFEVLYKKL